MAVRVLIVDDDPTFGALAAELLRGLGYEIAGYVSDAAQAIEAVQRLRPDAVMLDVNLPDSDGFRVAEAIREGDVTPPVLLVSSDGTHVQRRLVTRCGAAGFVAKADLATTDLTQYLRG